MARRHRGLPNAEWLIWGGSLTSERRPRARTWPLWVAVLAILAAAIFFSRPSPAAAAVCRQRAAVVAALALEFRERPAFQGLTAGGGLLEIFMSPARTWTLTVSTPKGVICILSVGTAFGPAVSIPPPPKGTAPEGRRP